MVRATEAVGLWTSSGSGSLTHSLARARLPDSEGDRHPPTVRSCRVRRFLSPTPASRSSGRPTPGAARCACPGGRSFRQGGVAGDIGSDGLCCWRGCRGEEGGWSADARGTVNPPQTVSIGAADTMALGPGARGWSRAAGLGLLSQGRLLACGVHSAAARARSDVRGISSAPKPSGSDLIDHIRWNE